MLEFDAAATDMAAHATLRRAVGLLNDFRYEKSDPARFYGALAADTRRLVGAFAPLDGAVVLDVGGGPGYFADAFRAAGAHYLSVEPDPAEMHAGGIAHRGTVRGSGQNLPFADSSMDMSSPPCHVLATPGPAHSRGEPLNVHRL